MIRILRIGFWGLIAFLLLAIFLLLACNGTSSIRGNDPDNKEESFYKSSLVVAHLHSDYPYTMYNQSMAIWNGKAFCFNDSSFSGTHGFCIIIDINTGNVLEKIMDVPYVISPSGNGASHLNNACFTDQYYDPADSYPLLLLSRGDYPKPNNKKVEELYVLRVVEDNHTYKFFHIKTILTKHDFLTTHNPSWDYDAERKMIWGHCLTEDWRWGEYVGQLYRSFNMPQGMYFKAHGASYVHLESRDLAAVSANISIKIGDVVRSLYVKPGDKISETFPYFENKGGCCYIMCSQDAKAFDKKFDVYACNQDGSNRVLIQLKAAIIGFHAPELTDTTTVVINNDEFTNPSYIGDGVLQGGFCANGKLFLPFHNYRYINGHISDYQKPVCLIVDPESGFVEDIIKLASPREPEGCAFYNGELFISHHVGNATDETKVPSFEIYKYSFK